ncbi:hypothetical protein [Streptosporangium saharense]|uniref:hypothetical protein n=1 Tax=Streptosporangium saharense TaxID=1706840 RepID=UPI00342E209E
METLLHEAAHALAHVRGVKDTSSGYRYHNKRFVRLAVELGLSAPAEPAPTIGWSHCPITDATTERYRAPIEALDAERLPYLDSPQRVLQRLTDGHDDPVGPYDGSDDLGDGEDGLGVDGFPGSLTTGPASSTGGRGRSGARFGVCCGCTPPRRLQVTPATWERGSIGCGACGQDFAPA